MEKIPMPIFRLGTINLAKELVLNKLFAQHRIGGRLTLALCRRVYMNAEH
jgi:hypothetical protein